MFCIVFCKQKAAYEMRISDWSSDVWSSDLSAPASAVSGAGCSAGAQRSELVQGRLIQKPSTASNRSSPASARTQSGSSQICGLATSLSAPDLGLRLQTAHSPDSSPSGPPHPNDRRMKNVLPTTPPFSPGNASPAPPAT